MKKNNFNYFLYTYIILFLIACGQQNPTSKNPGKYSIATGRPYNKGEGSFKVNKFNGQDPDRNLRLVFIDGGSHVMGGFAQNLIYSGDNPKKTVDVASFYMEETPVTNIAWNEYLDNLKSAPSAPQAAIDSSQSTLPVAEVDTIDAYQKALPDTTVWARKLAYNDSYVNNYLRHPGFRFFPVVGVTYEQAVEYCKWRTKIVNQYLSSKNSKKNQLEKDEILSLESGIILPEYRLPSEAEWEYAAKAMIGTQDLEFNQKNQRIYPWDGHSLRIEKGPYQGKFRANFKRGRGNYKGIAGESNSSGATSYVYEYPPNDLGLYDMAGNVNEWVADVYRPCTNEDSDDYNPVRRDGTLDKESNYDPVHSLINDNVHVIKGGSWKDVAYWLSPGTRRFVAKDSCSSTIGFRCAMTSTGSNN